MPQPGTQQPTAITLTPVAHLLLHVDRDGSTVYPEVSIDDARGVAYVCQPIDPTTLLEVAVWYVPDVSLLVLVLAPLLLIRHLWRVIARPQRPGVLHCRSCNYEMTPEQRRATVGHVPGSTSAPMPLCPECGKPLLRPVVGRTPIERIVGPVLLTALIIAACAGGIALTLEKPPWPGARLWPVPIVSTIFPSFKLTKLHSNSTPYRVVTRYQLPSGTKIGKPWRVTEEYVYSSALAPAGDYYITTAANWTSANPHSAALIFGTADGARLDVTLGSGNLAPTIRGFTRDGTGVYIQTQYTDSAAPSVTCDASLFAIDLRTGQRTPVTTVTSPMLNVPSRPEMPQQYFVVRDQETAPGAAPGWILYSHTSSARGTGATQTGEVVIPRVDSQPARRLPVSFSGTSIYPPALSDDGDSLSIDLYGTATPTTLTIDLVTGAFTESPATHPIGVTASRTKDLAVQQVAVTPGTAPTPGATIADRASGLPLALLHDAPYASGVLLSPAGRWAHTTVVSAPTPGWWTQLGLGGAGTSEVLVWDLRGLPPSSPATPKAGKTGD